MKFMRFQISYAALLLFATLTGSCTKEMAIQDKDGPGKKPFVAPPADSVPYEPAHTISDVANQMPMIASREFMEHGREHYEIHCLPCHGISGHGDGIVVQRGFPKPLPLDSVAENQRSDDKLYQIISNGKGTMSGYSHFITVNDRKSIVAYLRVLQLHQKISGGVK